MISVRSHQPQLNGNKWLFFICIALLTAGCSPKVLPVAAPVKNENPVPKKVEAPKPVIKPVIPHIPSIAMLLPFDLDNLNAGSKYTASTLYRAHLALDYYQGFKLALDSLTWLGYNYKLQIFDTKEQNAQAHSLAFNPLIRNSDLVIGPVFPDDLHAFTSVFTVNKLVVSPLSPASPAIIKNNNLVTVATPLEYHTWAAAKYIKNSIHPKKIFILRSGFSEENNYIIPFKRAVDSLSKRQVKVIIATISRGQLNSLIPQLSTTSENVFVVPSTNQAFLTVTLKALDTLSNDYSITLFGHPNWAKFTYLNAELLERLKTYVTSSDKIDYKSPPTLAFMRAYRRIYHVEPTEFSMIGYDEGIYFGSLLGSSNDGLIKIGQTDYEGLLNTFHFIQKPGLGWINTHVNLWKYSNFELKKAE